MRQKTISKDQPRDAPDVEASRQRFKAVTIKQQSPTFLAPGIGFVEDNFSMDWGGGDGYGMIQVHYIYCALYFYYYYFVIYNEIIIQLTIMQNQWEP